MNKFKDIKTLDECRRVHGIGKPCYRSECKLRDICPEWLVVHPSIEQLRRKIEAMLDKTIPRPTLDPEEEVHVHYDYGYMDGKEDAYREVLKLFDAETAGSEPKHVARRVLSNALRDGAMARRDVPDSPSEHAGQPSQSLQKKEG